MGFNNFFYCLETIVRQYKSRQMLFAIWALNNITPHRLFTARREVSSDSYHHLTTNDCEKLLDQEDIENTLMITVSIFLVLCMHIGLTRLLENGAFNDKFDADRRLCLGSTSLDWDDGAKIKDVITVNKDNKDEEKDPREKNRWLKKRKQYQKWATKAKTRPKTC